MRGVGPLQVVELLPDGQLGAQVDVAGVVEQLVELELVGEVRALDLAVEAGARRLVLTVWMRKGKRRTTWSMKSITFAWVCFS